MESFQSVLENRTSQTELGTVNLEPGTVKTYLAANPTVLDELVNDIASCETIVRWLTSKQRPEIKQASRAYMHIPETDCRYLNPAVSEIADDLLEVVTSCGDINKSMYKVGNVIASSIHAAYFSFYIVTNSENDLSMFSPVGKVKFFGPIGLGTTVAAHVAKTKYAVLTDDVLSDVRFPNNTGLHGTNDSQTVICVPIIMPHDDLIGLMEFTRTWENPFKKVDLQTVTALSVWASSALYQGQINRGLSKQTELNSFLLEVFKIIFEDVVSTEKLVTSIMSFSKDLVNADRTAIFLVDEAKQELYAEVFDTGEGDKFTKTEPIRFPITKGIAGHVAKTKEVVNIKNAYEDERFNKEVDKKTGYTTKNLLTMPIISKGTVIGVVQMVNKVNNEDTGFTDADEKNFETFAVYCAMALYLSKLYSSLQHQNVVHAITLDQLSYHQSASEDEYRMLVSKPFSNNVDPSKFNCYDFYGKEYDKDLPQIFMMMAHELFGPGVFSICKLAKFVLTVKKNYRPVAYHNWHHGFSVAHCVYCILIRALPTGLFTVHQAMGMFIGAICHDVDHRGYNNMGMKNIKHPIANLYSTSTMEEHHYVQTIAILQQEGHEIFEFLTEQQYKEMLVTIHQAILATDLALYFSNQKNLNKILDEGTYDLKEPKMNDYVASLCMTAADLCAICKPWPTQQETAVLIYEEFWLQGDEEKKMGLKPIPMMDRDFKDQMPKEQVGFIQFVCGPLYATLRRILPITSELQAGCDNNSIQWKKVLAMEDTKSWQSDLDQLKDKYKSKSKFAKK